MKMRFPLYLRYKQLSLKIYLKKADQHAGGKWLIHQTSQGQSVAKSGTPA